MNYIGQIRGFWRSHEEHSFSTTEVAVYFYLLEVCNICQWKNPFKRNNAKIGADLGISFNTLKNARNRLQQCGLITFKTTNGSPNVLYTLSNFDEVTNEVSTEVSTEVTNEVLPTKDKLNKTKQNLTPVSPQKIEDVQLPLEIPSKEESEKEIVKLVVNFYHENCKSLKPVKTVTDKRKAAVMARYREHGGTEAIKTMLINAGSSKFLAGQNERGWTADFDWIFKPENFVKVYEGKYNNRAQTPAAGSQTGGGTNSRLRIGTDYDEKF